MAAARRKGPPPWRAVRSRTCIPPATGPGAARACRGGHHGRGPLRTARGHGRGCPEFAARHRTSPRCGSRRGSTTAVRPGRQLARLPGALHVPHHTVQRSVWQRAMLAILVSQLLILFLALVVYLGRHAGT
ncbi:hypothetical protein [Streptomyces chattanoogensis]|uniref:Uncharacterized protein n=1 Tax=Streptomyces chattanoogensis TaxID=66876 RepID=A0A0N0XT29_9ACTN|nr:hypothetical protein [Streptomyces chattanoogensis]KPC60858.1 hypothetical protein ADL29_27250 [Streptomyces chattanoogensis]